MNWRLNYINIGTIIDCDGDSSLSVVFLIVILVVKSICHGELVEPLAALLGLRQAQTDMSGKCGDDRTIQISGLLLIAMVTLLCQ
jgi:hypothetical protein